MIVPTLAEFRALAKSGKLVPIYRDVLADLDTPVSAFARSTMALFVLIERRRGRREGGGSP